MQEMQVQSQGWENPLEEGMATHSSILARRIPWRRSLVDRGAWWATVYEVVRVGHDLVTKPPPHLYIYIYIYIYICTHTHIDTHDGILLKKE